LPGDTRPEWKCAGPDPLHAGQGAPGTHVEAEERANQNAIRRPQPSAPEDPGVRLADALPIIEADSEDRGAAGGAAGGVNARHLAGIDAQVVAKGRIGGLRRAQLVFLYHRKPRQIVQALQRVGGDAGFLPLASIKTALLPSVAELGAQLGEDRSIAFGRL